LGDRGIQLKSPASSQVLSLPPSRAVALELGGYRPCLEIGSGGMATVYIARELEKSGLERTVALKVMHDHLSRTGQFKQRFLDEARLLSRLSHPFVCRVLGYGEDNERPFMAMEYLVGEPLSRVLRTLKNPAHGLTCADRARLFGRVIADIAEGLHSAHETRDNAGQLLGVIHRDVSHQNLFMMYDGTVRILDFGIAWYKDRYVNTATTSRLVGKLPYMAPEQVRGNEYDRRADIWALGVILWELVSSDRLFRRDTEVQTMEAVCFAPIPFIGEVAEGIAPGFDHIVARALQRDPEQRYQTARELAHDLEVWLTRTGQPVTRADLSRVLSDFFPGSEQERRRWAELSPPSHPNRRIPQVDFAKEALAAFGPDTSSLELLPRLPREAEIMSAEFIPPQVLRSAATYEVVQLKPTYDVESDDLLSNPPSTNASPVAVSVREEPIPISRATWKRRWQIGTASLGLSLGVLIGVTVLSEQSTTDTGPVAIVPLSIPHAEPASAVTESRPSASVARQAGEPSFVQPFASATEVHSTSSADSNATAVAPSPSAQKPPKVEPGAPPKPTPQAPTNTGDVLIVSPTRGANVYLGSRLLGQTPLRTRLPVGVARLSVQLAPDGPRTAVQTTVTADRLNVVSAK
jgi:serine/threonine protein kinase